MNRVDGALSRIFMVIMSVLFTLILIEIGARYYLFNRKFLTT